MISKAEYHQQKITQLRNRIDNYLRQDHINLPIKLFITDVLINDLTILVQDLTIKGWQSEIKDNMIIIR